MISGLVLKYLNGECFVIRRGYENSPPRLKLVLSDSTLAGHEQGLMPAISCNLALVWAAAQARHWADLEDMHLAGWRTGLAWSERLNVLFPKK